jgi:hypothetical protein
LVRFISFDGFFSSQNQQHFSAVVIFDGDTFEHFAAFTSLGIAMGCCAYEASFAFVIRHLDQCACRVIAKMTLVAGLGQGCLL